MIGCRGIKEFFVSFIIAGFVQNWLICLPISILLMIGTLLVIKAITKKKS